MEQDRAPDRPARTALLTVGYVVVLAVLLLTPSPGTLVTVAAMGWIVLGMVMWTRSSPSASSRARRERRQQRRATGRGRRGAWGMIQQQGPTRGRRGDNPHR